MNVLLIRARGRFRSGRAGTPPPLPPAAQPRGGTARHTDLSKVLTQKKGLGNAPRYRAADLASARLLSLLIYQCLFDALRELLTIILEHACICAPFNLSSFGRLGCNKLMSRLARSLVKLLVLPRLVNTFIQEERLPLSIRTCPRTSSCACAYLARF